MLNCRDVTRKASLLIDGELRLYERVQVRIHLAMCAHCRRFLRQFRMLNEALALRHRRATEPPSDEFVGRILSSFRTQSSGSSLQDEPGARPGDGDRV